MDPVQRKAKTIRYQYPRRLIVFTTEMIFCTEIRNEALQCRNDCQTDPLVVLS
jgi:hypothetical protein